MAVVLPTDSATDLVHQAIAIVVLGVLDTRADNVPILPEALDLAAGTETIILGGEVATDHGVLCPGAETKEGILVITVEEEEVRNARTRIALPQRRP